MSNAPFKYIPQWSRVRLRYLFVSGLVGLILSVSALGGDIQTGIENSRQLAKQGEKMIKKGKFADAERLLRRAVDASPDDSSIKLRLAYVYVKQRRVHDAYRLSFKIAEAEPDNSEAYAVLGSTFLAAGKFPQARAMFYQSLNLNKKEAMAWAGLGMLEFYENRITESIRRLEEAVYREPNHPDYVFALAQVSARAEKFKEAADAYYHFLVISKDTDDERRERIRGLIGFLRYLGTRQNLYETSGTATTVPIEVVGNRPIIELRVNGRVRPLRFVLDTGSGISVLSEETAKELSIEPVAKGGFAKGIGGDGKFPIVYGFLRELQIGDVQIKSVPIYIRKFHSNGQHIDGYIGLSLISKFLMRLDYGSRTFTLEKNLPSQTEIDDTDISVPLRLTSSGFLSGEVKLDGLETPLNFIVDTGASVSVISDQIASLDEFQPHATDEKMRVIGSAGVTESVPSYLLPGVTFGQHQRSSITAIALDLNMINEASGFEQSGILGGNFLKNYIMTFDFKRSKVTFTPIAVEK